MRITHLPSLNTLRHRQRRLGTYSLTHPLTRSLNHSLNNRKLHHPNLLQVYMVYTDGSDQLCMSMEYMALGRLYDVIKNHSLFLDYEKIKRILIGASHAMAYLHNQHARTIHGVCCNK